MTRPSQKLIRQVLHYTPETGIFRRIGKVGCKGLIGQEVGSLKKHGYIVIQVAGHRDYAHRFAWAYMTGKWPKEMDHINGDRSDNRWVNLRLATRTQNNGNRKFSHKKKHSHLPKGVIQRRRPSGYTSYYARIVVNNKQICSPSYKTAQEAHLAYIELANRYFGEFARAA